MTEFERKTLEYLATQTRKVYPSAVGYALQEHCDPETRKPNPSPQGMALFAGRFLSPLRKAGLVDSYKGWSITQKGREALQ